MKRPPLIAHLFLQLILLAGFAQASSALPRGIVIGPNAAPIEQLAAKELQRYLCQASETFLEIQPDGKPGPGSFIVGQPKNNPLIAKLVGQKRIILSETDPGPQGYITKQVDLGNGTPAVVIAANDDVGCLYGVYGLLEDHFGLTFGFAGDVLPDERKSLDLPGLDERHTPSVAIRGVLPWSNFPESTTIYSWADWKAVIDQMAKMRMNLLMVHNYNGDGGCFEMYHNYPVDGKLPRVSLGHTKGGYMIGGPPWVPWEYRFHARDLMDDCDFGAEAMLHGESLSNEEIFARGVTMFQRVIDYAHTRGVKIALGTDINYPLRGYNTPETLARPNIEAEPQVVKDRIGQVIRDYPNLDYFIAFCWEGMPQFKNTAPIWYKTIDLIRKELHEKAPGIKPAVSGWGNRNEYIDDLPQDVIVAPIAPYGPKPQPGSQFGNRDYWACPWMEKDNDDSMFYFPYRVLLSETVDAWQNRSANTKGLYALTWRMTDAIDAKLWYIARAPWDAQNKMKTSRDAYHAYAVANYGSAAAEAVTPIIDQNEAFATNMCEMGGPRPFREFATIMFNRVTASFKSFTVPGKATVPAVLFYHRTGGKPTKLGTPGAYVDEINSGLAFQFKNVDFGQGADEVQVEAASIPGARVEFRVGDEDGPLLGQGVIPKTRGWEDFVKIAFPIKRTSGLQTITVNFSAEVYPRKELVKAEGQIAIVDGCMAKASPTQRQRLSLLRTRLAAVREHIRLNLEFPEYKLRDLPGAMESWVMNYIRRVDDISSLGTLTSIENRYVQHTYLRKKVDSMYVGKAIRPPFDVEARGTLDGTQIEWREADSSGLVNGFRVYRDGQLLTPKELPAAQNQFIDKATGEFNYTVTAIAANGKESLPSVKSRCLSGSADKEPPCVVMVSPPLSALTGQPVAIKARVIDGRTYECLSAILHYRKLGEANWQSQPMTRRVHAVFIATLTPEMLGSNGVEYYVEAGDGTNASRFPWAAPKRNLSLILESGPAPAKLAPPVVRGENNALRWKEDPNAHWYRIYRGRSAGFEVGSQSYLTYAARGTTTFKDMEEDFDGHPLEGAYYYRVTAMDRRGFESAPSAPVALRSLTVLPHRTAVLSGHVNLGRAPAGTTRTGWVFSDFAKEKDQILFKGVPASVGMRVRYSNGNKGSTRCGLYVTGKRAATLNFPPTTAEGDEGYADGKRLANKLVAATGDWKTFKVLTVDAPVSGEVALRIDDEDASSNGGVCCRIEQIELEPADKF